MVQRRAAGFCQNDYKTIEKGCVTKMIRKLNLEPLNTTRTNKRLAIFHKTINGHLALPIEHLQPVLRSKGVLGDKKIKIPGNVMNCPENLKVTKHIFLKSISECNYPERLHC